MKTAVLFAFTLAGCLTARADFSYISTSKVTGGSAAAMAGQAANRTTKLSLKGQKLASSTPENTVIIDFGAQTVTTINTAQKTYTVKKFGEVNSSAATVDATVEVKDTGQKKTVNGFNASEVIVTVNTEMETGRGPAMKMQMEMDLWISSEVPGVAELRDFYKKNLANFPWNAMMGGTNPSMQKAMVQLQKKMAELDGVEVERVIRVKPAGGTQMPAMPAMPQMPQMTAAQQAQMQQAMAKMQAMSQQGGPGAAAAQQAMAAMANMGRGGPTAAGGAQGSGAGSLMEITSDSSGFSNASVSDSAFAIPEGFKLAQ